ncbi:MAG: alpha-glucosidase [Frankiaceae bacterium]|jgi:alpha-glucosidase|nr:alpha-glucosidase [Frankiaceae bacterium]
MAPTEQPAQRPWWRDAVVYQVYVRSFADTNGDGVGDLTGVRMHLPYLASLGVDALWLTPFYVSPMADHGYDVADPRDVDPLFGSLADYDALIAEAHALGLRVVNDTVPNHTSDRHPWFVEALASPPGSTARERYVFRDGRGANGDEPPNNWQSTFGGPAWRRVIGADGTPEQWYLHLFAPEQPDLNWRNPEVGDDAERTLRFWLDRGADGFRIDVAHGLHKDPELRDNPSTEVSTNLIGNETRHTWDQPEVHDVYRRWREVFDSYDGDRVAIGEVWVGDPERWAAYVRPDELHLLFTFSLTIAPWSATAWRTAVADALTSVGAVGASATWVLGNHDVSRPVTRYGSVERARAGLLTTLALPGAYYLYQGDELGLPDVDVPPAMRQDPMWERLGVGRDGCRAPMPWDSDEPHTGFSTAEPWLPEGPDWPELAVDVQAGDPMSTLVLTRGALALRKRVPALGHGTGELVWHEAPADALVFERPGAPAVLCATNFGTVDVELTLPGQLLLASAPITYDGTTLTLPPDTAVWLVPEA